MRLLNKYNWENVKKHMTGGGDVNILPYTIHIL